MLSLLSVCKQNGLVEERYEGIYEIYPRKFTNSMVLDKVVVDFKKKGYDVFKVTDNWIRAMKQNA